MKTKNTLIDILIIILAITPLFIVFTGKELPKRIDNGLGFTAGFSFALIGFYFGTKAKFRERSNAELQILKWQKLFLILFFSVSLLLLFYKYEVIKSPFPLLTLPFIMLMILGNYQPIITQDSTDILFFYLEDEEVRIKTQRFLGKITFAIGLIGIGTCFFVEGKKLFVIFILWVFLTIFITYFYSKHLYNKKYSS